MKRVRNFEHVEGREATARHIANIIFPFAETIVQENVNIYSSTDFKVHVHTNLLVHYSELACDFLEMDPRGAHSGQLVMQDAVRKAIWDADLQPKLLSNTVALGKPIEEVVAIIAYKLRVLLAHYRLKYDSHTPGLPAPSGLENVFDRMQAPSHYQPSSKRARRMERLSSRPHPFVHFRQEEQPSDEDHEEVDIVSTFFDTASADSYDPGPNGFVVARWSLDKRTQELEFVNSCSVGGQLVIPRASQVISRRPARAMRADQELEDEPEEAEDAEDEDEEATQQLELKSNATEVHLKLAPGHSVNLGHNVNFKIHIKNSHKKSATRSEPTFPSITTRQQLIWREASGCRAL